MRQLTDASTLNTWVQRFNEVVGSSLMSFYNDSDLNSGLNFHVSGGLLRSGATAFEDVQTATVALTDNAVNYVYIDGGTYALAASTSVPGGEHLAVYKVTTSAGAITQIQDLRTFAQRAIAPTHASLLERHVANTHPRYEIPKAIGNVSSPMTHLPLSTVADVIKMVGNAQFAREADATFTDRYDILQTSTHYAGTVSISDSTSIVDIAATFSDMDGYIAYLTDGANFAYRNVEAWHETKVIWSKPVSFNATSYKLTKLRFNEKGLIDQLSIPTKGNLPPLNKSWSILFDAILAAEIPGADNAIIDDGGIAATNFAIYQSSTGNIVVRHKSATNSAILEAEYTAINKNRFGFVSNGTNISVYLNGVFLRTVAMDTTFESAASLLHIQRNAIGSNFVRNLRIYDNALSAEQMRVA